MPTLAIIGDVHGNEQRLAASLGLLDGVAFDLALVAGDIGLDPPWESPARERERDAHDASVHRVLTSVRQTLGCDVVFVPGNHDLRDPVPVPGVHNIDRVATEVAGLRVAGLGGAGPAQFGFPYEWTEKQAEVSLEATLGGATRPVDILLSHTPPADTSLDRTFHGLHVGSVAVRRHIESLPPRLFVCGHIHESWGLERIAGVPCVNAGALAPPAEQDIAWVVAWDGKPTRIEMRRHDDYGKVQTRTWQGVKSWPAP